MEKMKKNEKMKIQTIKSIAILTALSLLSLTPTLINFVTASDYSSAKFQVTTCNYQNQLRPGRKTTNALNDGCNYILPIAEEIAVMEQEEQAMINLDADIVEMKALCEEIVYPTPFLIEQCDIVGIDVRDF